MMNMNLFNQIEATINNLMASGQPVTEQLQNTYAKLLEQMLNDNTEPVSSTEKQPPDVNDNKQKEIGDTITKDGKTYKIIGEDADFYYIDNNGNPESVKKPAEKGTPEFYAGIKNGDYSMIDSDEDFLSDGLYQYVYGGLLPEDMIPSAEYKLEDIARTIGKTRLEKLFKQRKSRMLNQIKSAKAETVRLKQKEQEKYARENGHMTEFDDVPDTCTGNKYVGYEWLTNDGVVFREIASGQTTRTEYACNAPALINRQVVYIDKDDDECESYELMFKGSDNRWKTTIVDRETLVNSNKVIALAKSGLAISSDLTRAFSAYMLSMMTEQQKRGGFPKMKVSNKLLITKGKEKIATYDDNDLAFGRKNDFKNIVDALSERGSRDEWFDAYKRLRATNNLSLNFSTAAMLSAPLISVLNTDGFVCNLYGRSHCGKTTISRVATTIWGDYRQKSGFVYNPKNTSCSKEIALDTLNELPFIMEDFNNLTLKEKKEFMPTVMDIANGMGKGRANKNMGLREPLSWSTIGFISSEQPITSYYTTGGGFNRTLSCKMPSQFPWMYENGRVATGDILACFQSRSGHAGREYIKILNTIGKDRIIEIFEDFQDKIIPIAEEQKRSPGQTAILAVLLTADYIAGEMLFCDGIHINIEDAVGLMDYDGAVDQNMRFYEEIESNFFKYIDRFEGTHNDVLGYDKNESNFKNGCYGIYEEEIIDGDHIGRKLFMQEEYLKEWAAECDVNLKMFYDDMKEAGLMESYNGRNKVRKTFKHSSVKRVMLVCIKLPDIDVSDEDTEKKNNKNTTYVIFDKGVYRPGTFEEAQAACLQEEIPFETTKEATQKQTDEKYIQYNIDDDTFADID